MTRKRRVILPRVALACASGVVGYCLDLSGWGTAKQSGSDGVVLARNLVYTTRPLKPAEIGARLQPANFPTGATDFQFAQYDEWLAHEFYLTFRAPPDVCLAFAQQVIDDHTCGTLTSRLPR